MKVIICVLQQEFTMEIGDREPVLDIKKRIEQFLGIPTSSQTLSVSDWELVDGLDMEDYPIVSEGTRIDLAILTVDKIPIIVRLSARQQHVIDVDPAAETVRSLKQKIHIIDGTPIQRISLVFSGRELGDENRSLSEYGITRGFAEIAVVRKAEDRPMAVMRSIGFVVQMSSSLVGGASVPVQASLASTVSDVRRYLLAMKILPSDDYLFVHRQRIMRDDLSLKCHGVEDGDFLFVFKGTVSPGEF